MSRVVFLLVEGVELFDFAGPAQAFHEAALAGATYEVHYVGPTEHITSEQRLSIAELEPLPGDLGAGDIVIVAGSNLFRERKAQHRAIRREMIAWLAASYLAGATITSVCIGAFLLGDAGLLDGRRCTTHWKRVEKLAADFPKANVLANRLYVFDDRIATSAGIASGIDLALALIERRDGRRIAAAVAREMVVSVRRSGEDEQLGATFANREHFAPDVHLVQDWLVEHPGEPCSIDDLASRAGLSARTLTRQFKAATGLTVHEYATQLRLEQARTLLADRAMTIDGVAERCGFSDGRQLRRLWKDHFGVSPSAQRVNSEPR